jgi:TrmH family RNA methyltransferase
MSEASILSRFAIVLWRPKSPGNVGSVARAMKNMGFSRLRIADSIRYRDPSFFSNESERMAWGAGDLLAARQEHPSIEAAVADASLVVGTASDPPRDRRAHPPRDLAPRLLEAASDGTVALLFGQEDIGLTREALARCQLLASPCPGGSSRRGSRHQRRTPTAPPRADRPRRRWRVSSRD